MPNGRPQLPRIRMPKVTWPGRASRAASERTTTTKPVAAEAAKPGNGAEPAATAAKGAAPGTPAPKETKPAVTPRPGAPVADADVRDRIEGLQGWMAELERKQARTTYFGAVAIAIAIAAAGAALYFGITNKNDSATKGDVDGLRSRVEALQKAVTKNSKDTQDTINSSITQLQASIQALQKQQAQDAANISTLQSQAAAGAFNPKQPNAAGAAGTALTPGTSTTTPKKP